MRCSTSRGLVGNRQSASGGHDQLPGHPIVHRGAAADTGSAVVRVVAGRRELPRPPAAGGRPVGDRPRWPRVCGGATTIRRRSPTVATGCPRRPSSVTPCATPCRWAPGESDQLHRAGRHGDPILDQLRSAYGQDFLDTIPNRWAGSPTRLNRRRCWLSRQRGGRVHHRAGHLGRRRQHRGPPGRGLREGFPSWQP
jgi:hypothetical protein